MAADDDYTAWYSPADGRWHMEFLLIDLGAAMAALLGYAAFLRPGASVAANTRQGL